MQKQEISHLQWRINTDWEEMERFS